jgi:hypothetical protein
MRRSDYGPLRDESQKRLEALNNHIEQTTPQPAGPEVAADREATRPEGQVRQSPGWTSYGGYVEHQASANTWHKEANSPERLAALNQHIERADAGQKPEQSPDRENDLSRKPDDIER